MYRLILILLPFFTFSQTTVFDDFSDGNFHSNPMWYGDSSRFLVDSQFTLSLADTIANQSTLATASPIALDASWELEFRLDFNPSASNFARFYLMYNRSWPDGQGQGYYLEIGGSSSDQVSLYKCSANQSTLLLASAVDLLDKNDNHLAVRVARNAHHYWFLEIDTLLNGSYFKVDSVQDSSYFQSQIMAWQCNYTRTRADKFFLHKVLAQGDVFRDTTAPQVDSTEVRNRDLIIYFNEPLDSSLSIHFQNFYLDSTDRPTSLSLDSINRHKLGLSFAQAFPANKNLKLYYKDVYDLAGNPAEGEITFLNYQAQRGHLLINEMMIDPSPPVALPPQALPESEYVELYNASSFSLNLKDWRLRINDKDYVFPNYRLPPETYLLLVNGSKLDGFVKFAPCLDIGLSAFSLLNDGAALQLFSADNFLVDALEYQADWYNDPLKSDGGWSLERSIGSSYCRGFSQWQASQSPQGGTPGTVNSVSGAAIDTLAPKVQFIAWEEEAILFKFNESIKATAPLKATNIQTEPHLEIDSLSWSLNQDLLKMHLAQAPIYGQEYSLSFLDSLSDCSGNTSLFVNLPFALPVDAQEGDIFISEILFAPKSGGADFIEIYNSSAKVFDLAHLHIARWDKDLGAYDIEDLSSESQLFFPGEYLALSEDVQFLRENYFCARANLSEASLPTFPSDEGAFALLNARLEIIDRGNYADDWHFKLLEETSGISLERIDFTHLPTSEKHWQSATEREAYATPGRANSQQAFIMQNADWEAIPPYFSPNGDGNLDEAQLYFKCEGGASVVTVEIYSAKGEKLRTMAEYDYSAEQGYFLWDGFNNDGQLLGAGIYIAVLEYYNDQGISAVMRTPIVLSR